MKMQPTGSMADDYLFRVYSLAYYRLLVTWLDRVVGKPERQR
jgi:hypothetical protein